MRDSDVTQECRCARGMMRMRTPSYVRIWVAHEYYFYPADNELPDYIMVMLANKKTFPQINNDLHLFLASNTNHFTEWLKKVLADPDLLKREGVCEQSVCTYCV